MESDPIINKAIRHLGIKRFFYHGDRRFVVAFLLRPEDIRPLDAPWWRGKQVSIIGGDLNGNFFLRHPDGSVRYWDHAKQVDEVVSPSVRQFAWSITEEERDDL